MNNVEALSPGSLKLKRNELGLAINNGLLESLYGNNYFSNLGIGLTSRE